MKCTAPLPLLAWPPAGRLTHALLPPTAHTRAQKPSTFFSDEWRTPTYVADLVAACHSAVELCEQLTVAAAERVFNVGGPERINRVDMALALCKASCCACGRNALGAAWWGGRSTSAWV